MLWFYYIPVVPNFNNSEVGWLRASDLASNSLGICLLNSYRKHNFMIIGFCVAILISVSSSMILIMFSLSVNIQKYDISWDCIIVAGKTPNVCVEAVPPTGCEWSVLLLKVRSET